MVNASERLRCTASVMRGLAHYWRASIWPRITGLWWIMRRCGSGSLSPGFGSRVVGGRHIVRHGNVVRVGEIWYRSTARSMIGLRGVVPGRC